MQISWKSPFTGEIKTLKLKKDPLRHGLGHYEDIEGNTWDVVCITGADHTVIKKPYINARLVSLTNPYYNTSTYGHSFGNHKWEPFYFEVIEEKVEECNTKK